MRLVIWFVSFACMLSAQDRRAHPGRVLDGAGKPVVGAAVTLLYAPAFARELGGNDVVTTTTDDRGRFRASLLSGARYSAICGSPAGCSRAVDVVPGRMTELRLFGSGPHAEVAIEGLASWSDLEPIQVRFAVNHLGPLGQPVPVRDGRVALPAILPGALRAEFFDRDGNVFFVTNNFGIAPNFLLPAPQTVKVFVVDADNTPIAGAEVVQRFESWDGRQSVFAMARPSAVLRQHGRTGDDGSITLRVASPEDIFDTNAMSSFVLVVRNEGRVGICGTDFGKHLGESGLDAKQRRERTFRVVLRDGVRLQALVRGNKSRRGEHALARLLVPIGAGANTSARFCDVRIDVETEAGSDDESVGVTESLIWPKGTKVLAWLLPIPRIELGADDRFRRVVTREPMIMPGTELRCEVDVDALQVLRVQAREANGNPAADIVWWALPAGAPDSYIDRYLPRGCADPAGRVALPLAPGEWLIGMASANGYAMVGIEVGEAPLEMIDLPLQPFAVMEVLAVDDGGAPLQNVEVYAPNRSVSEPPGAIPRLQSALTRAMTHSLVTARTRSDAKGRISLRYVPAEDSEWTLQLRHGPRHSTARKSRKFLLEPAAEPVRLVIK